MITGSLRPNLYDAPPVADAIERALARGVRIGIIIVGAEPNLAVLDPQHWVQRGIAEGKVNLWHVPQEGIPHVIMVDAVHIRMEDMSQHNHESRRRGLCRYYGPRFVKRTNAIFETLRDRVVQKAAANVVQEVA